MIKKREKRKVSHREVFIWSLLVVFLVESIGMIFSSMGTGSFWFKAIRPAITPPNWVFPIVWNILYVLIAVSLFLAWINSPAGKKKTVGWIFGINLFLNCLWTFLFFARHNALAAFYDLIFLWITIIIMMVVAWRRSKVSAILLIPYLLWISFAFVINLYIV